MLHNIKTHRWGTVPSATCTNFRVRAQILLYSVCFNVWIHFLSLSLSLMCMWQRMCESHQVQNHIAQQLNHLPNHSTMEPTTEYHQQAAAQLKNEVTCWYNSFVKLVKSQKEYTTSLCSWIQLTNSIADAGGQRSRTSSSVHKLSEQWLCELNKLPDKVHFLDFVFTFFVVFVENEFLFLPCS